MNAQALVIGLGNPDRGDDAVGLHVARRLAAWALPGVTVIEADGDALALMDRWAGAARVVLVDAAAPMSQPGRVHRLDPMRQELPHEITLGSTHAFGLTEAVELARALGRLPGWMAIYAIEAGGFVPGASLTPAVAGAVDEAAARIAAELRPEVAGVGQGRTDHA